MCTNQPIKVLAYSTVSTKKSEIPMWNFCLWMTEIYFRNDFINLIKTTAPETEIFQGIFDIIIFSTPSNLYVNLECFSCIEALIEGLKPYYIPWYAACGERNIILTTASPNFTLSYPAVIGMHASCGWLVTSPPNTKITVEQTDAIRCCGSFRVGNGHDPTDMAKFIELRGIPNNRALVSDGNTIYVTFETKLTFLTFELFFKATENGES